MAVESLADAVIAEGAIDVIVGVSVDGREEFVASGRSRLDPRTAVLEAGSITKTVMGLTLARLALAGEVGPDTRIGDAYPDLPGVVAAITLEELATHTSGLPRLAPNLWEGAERRNPYAHFGESHLRGALETTTVGTKSYAYSNFGFGVLGAALAELTRVPLPRLVDQLVFTPLGLTSTRLSVIGEQPVSADVMGFGTDGLTTSQWDFTPCTAGCGAMRTTVLDLLTYVTAYGSDDHELAPAMELALMPRTSTEEGFDVAYAWRCRDALRWHPGGTGGFGGLVAFQAGRAIAVLTNIGHHVWRAADDLLLSFVR